MEVERYEDRLQLNGVTGAFLMRETILLVVTQSSSNPPWVTLCESAPGAVKTLMLLADGMRLSKYFCMPRMGVVTPSSKDWETR